MPPGDWNEEHTRKKLIDRMLSESGWAPLAPFEAGKSYTKASVEEYPTASGPADYILFNKGRAVSAVEGKKVAVGPQNVLQQAQRYARSIQNTPFNFNEFKLPFVYSTNGVNIWFQDLRHPLNRSREVSAIHTPDALEEILARKEDVSTQWLLGHPVDDQYTRPYQKEAIQETEAAIMNRKRNMLIAMATGNKMRRAHGRDKHTYQEN
jgi:type I restriction enzyme R subunit